MENDKQTMKRYGRRTGRMNVIFGQGRAWPENDVLNFTKYDGMLTVMQTLLCLTKG